MGERIGVVGGGILGVAVARRLLQERPDAQVTVLEKEDRLAQHQTGHNSGVVHAGLYYQPGSLKAVLCRRGVHLLEEFCGEHGIDYDRCGKLLVALDGEDERRMLAIHERAVANGVPGVRLVGPEQMREVEPYVTGVAGLHSPATAIVDYRAVTEAMAAEAAAAGTVVSTGHEVTGVSQQGGEVLVSTPQGMTPFDRLVVCAGLGGDRVAAMAGDEPDPSIVPFRGEYWLLRPDRRYLCRGLIYPVPDPRYPFLGVHLTKRVDGEVLVGPNAVLATAREGYRRRDVSATDMQELVRWPGFWKMARSHWRTGVREVAGSASKHLFVRAARQYVPALRVEDVIPGPAGVRAQAVARDGSLVDDFRISTRGRVVAVRNAPSPGATSSLAIAEYVVETVLSG